jgi:hypothetical protein
LYATKGLIGVKNPAEPEILGLDSLLHYYSTKIDKTMNFYKKSVIFDGFWRFFEVSSILAEYYCKNSIDLFQNIFVDFLTPLVAPHG